MEQYECQICVGLDVVKDLHFTNIVEHLEVFHNISKSKLRAFGIENNAQGKKDGHYMVQSVVKQVKQLPQVSESQKRKVVVSHSVNPSAIGAKRVRNQRNHLEAPQAIPILQLQLQPTVRPPPPYPRFPYVPLQPYPPFNHLHPQPYPRFHHLPPPNGTRPDPFYFGGSYPDPGDDGWRMWR